MWMFVLDKNCWNRQRFVICIDFRMAVLMRSGNGSGSRGNLDNLIRDQTRVNLFKPQTSWKRSETQDAALTQLQRAVSCSEQTVLNWRPRRLDRADEHNAPRSCLFFRTMLPKMQYWGILFSSLGHLIGLKGSWVTIKVVKGRWTIIAVILIQL